MIAPHRIGKPSPLPLHLGAAAFAYAQSMQLAPIADHQEFPWHPDLAVPRFGHLSNHHIQAEALHRLEAMLDGIEKWQCHPYRRVEPDLPVIWSDGASRLIDYGGEGAPVLVLPSLINRAYVLDLLPERSMLQYFSTAGLHPYLLDWGYPSHLEQNFNLDAYCSRRLLPALAAVAVHSGHKPTLLGYCMGGTLAAGLAAQTTQISGLVTIGAPWSFELSKGMPGQMRTASHLLGISKVEATLSQIAEVFGFIPVEILQSLFAMINPIQAARKFRRFAKMDQNSLEARIFVALEDWLADGVPLTAPLAQDVMVNWQLRDAAACGKWNLMGQRVDPRQATCPAMIVSGTKDTIAPPEQTVPLARALPSATSLQVDMGHVSMVTGRHAQKSVWQPIAEFITGHF